MKVLASALAFCLIFLNGIQAQDSSAVTDNIIISSSDIEYTFVKGDSKYPVQIKVIDRKIYTCVNYRSEILIHEFYNKMNTVEDVAISIDGKRANTIIPQHTFYNSDGIFHSDQRVFYFSLPLAKTGSNGEVRIEKTFLEPYYFTSIFLVNTYPTRQQHIVINVPHWMDIELKEINFAGFNIIKTRNIVDKMTVYTFTAKDIEAFAEETGAPGPTHTYPYILVHNKKAKVDDRTITYFNALSDQYLWYKNLTSVVDNDKNYIKEQTFSLVRPEQSEEEKVKTIFQWVQDNIRYIAFEDGIAGFQPDNAQSVLQKKYGDCKGMANLMVEMLRSIGLDARKCWIGTRHIAHDYSIPNLSDDNHMICAWIKKDEIFYLDATEKYIGFGEIAERIQGRPSLMEDGDNFKMMQVPIMNHNQNTSIENRVLKIVGNNLTGHVTQNWKGENKEYMLAGYHNLEQDKQESALKKYLAHHDKNIEVTNLSVENISNYNQKLSVEYDLVWNDAVSTFGNSSYLGLDNRRLFDNYKFDLIKRKLPFQFSFKDHSILQIELEIPSGKKLVNLPEKISINKKGYSFEASYSVSGGKLIYKNEIIIRDTNLALTDLKEWNKDIDQLTTFYNEQIELTAQ